MDILVLGAGGLLGGNVICEAIYRNISVAGTYRTERPAFEIPLRQFDIQDTSTFRELIEVFDPACVVNCAAMTGVDACERHPDTAQETNAEAPESIARVCNDRQIEFVHVSTDYVFDGDSDTRYDEDSQTNPVQQYGRTKLAGDRGVLTVHDSPLLIRPSFVYGVGRTSTDPELKGFVQWIVTQLREGGEVPLFTDQNVTPSRAGTTARTILDLVAVEASGLFNVAARSCVTPYEFGRLVASQIDVETDTIVESSLADMDRDATRPANTCLSVEKIESKLERPQPTLSEDLAALASYL
jgi:dTDP-4-dehydrorhamnose reductase